MTNTSLIIPSAGLAKRLFPLSANTPKVLIKLNGVPIFHLLYKQAKELKVDNIILIVSPEFERQLKDFIADVYHNSDIPIHVQIDDKPEGVLSSVYKGTSHSEAKEKSLVILSDTLYSGKLPLEDKSFVVYQEVPSPLNRWCLAETNEFGQIEKFWDKPQGDCPTNKALIGIYYLKTLEFNVCSKAVFDIGNKVRGEYQISQALEKYMTLEGKEIFAIKAEEGKWHDTGTLETLKEASSNFFLSRSFNNIEVKDNILVKKSQNKEMLRNQYVWFQNIENQSIIPHIYGYKEYPTHGELSMEFCNLQDLGTVFNFGQAEPVFFEQSIRYILKVLDKEFYKEFYEQDPGINYRMFFEKTLARMDEWPEGLDVLVSPHIGDFFDELEQISQTSYSTKIHGDLILSNILFDPQRLSFKLIDPRGRYDKAGVYGDMRYDLAKLLHSMDGKYETIIHSLYKINDNTVEYLLSPKKIECFELGKKLIYEYAETKGLKKRDLDILHASLYYSMIPLHSEDKHRQIAFVLIGNRILKELYENSGV